MKKILTIGVAIIVFSLTLYLILLTFYKPNGKVNKVKIDYGSSVKFDETELKTAVNCVLTEFKEYKGCKLLNLWYDEEKSDYYLEEHFSNNDGGYSKEDTIVLYSDFKVNFTGGVGGSFNPNSTYNNWVWVLTRDSKTDSWIVSSAGYL